jgi:hypothetical protein
VCALSLILAVGCALADSMLKAGPAPNSAFLNENEPDRLAEHRERFPFNRAWVEEGFRIDDYDSVVVAPVNTDYARDRSTWARMNVREFSVDDDLAEIGEEFQKDVIDAFHDAPENRLAVVDAPGNAKTLVLELAITELVPSKAFLATIGLASWAAPLVIGIPVGTAAAFAQTGWMAFEGRVRAAKDGRVVIMFADREQAKTRVIDAKALTWYSHARESMGDWAHQLVELANTPRGFEVEDSSSFELLPW